MLLALLRLVAAINGFALRIGRAIAWIALALMVAVILLQVFFRYVLNDALNWPDEAARFLMLWMTGLIAPSAYRWGGFVFIETFPSMLPRAAGLIFALFLLGASMIVLCFAIGFGYDHVAGFGGNFNSSTLRIPLEWIGGETVKVKLRYMFASLFVGVILLAAVNVELTLRTLASLLHPKAEQPEDDRFPTSLEGAS